MGVILKIKILGYSEELYPFLMIFVKKCGILLVIYRKNEGCKMSSIEKTFTNDEIYQKIVNLYGADFVEKYYLVFDKVFGLIDISDYNIDDVQKNKLFSNAI